jgi:hypothetical protein
MSVAATRGSRMEKWYRRLLALYPKDHRREHAEEMVGVLLAADGDVQLRAPKPAAFSSTQTLKLGLSCFRRMALARPAGPAPTIATSYSMTSRAASLI